MNEASAAFSGSRACGVRGMVPRHRMGFAALCCLLVALPGLFGCKDENGGTPAAAKSAAAPQSVKLVPVQTRGVDRFIEVTGTLFGEEDVTIAAEVPGQLVTIAVDLGDVVASGGALAQVDPTDYVLVVNELRAQLGAALAKVGLEQLPEGQPDLDVLPVVARAQAQEANAKAKLERARKLYERQPPLISEQDFADIQTQHEVASTNVASERLNAKSLLADVFVSSSSLGKAQQRLKDATIVAPVGKELRYRVASRRVSVGEVVAAGQPLFRLVATDRVKFRGQVPERFAADVRVGAAAYLAVDGIAAPFAATVSRIAPAVDVSTRSFEIEIEAANLDGQLKPGGFVRVKIQSGRDESARFVPRTAVVEFAGVQRVLGVKEGKVAEFRVRLGGQDGDRVEVSGLPVGIDAVIDAPARGLSTGVVVTPLP
jgi:RND family efflux transporter MFP subunit